jgi:hypothetical protein
VGAAIQRGVFRQEIVPFTTQIKVTDEATGRKPYEFSPPLRQAQRQQGRDGRL